MGASQPGVANCAGQVTSICTTSGVADCERKAVTNLLYWSVATDGSCTYSTLILPAFIWLNLLISAVCSPVVSINAANWIVTGPEVVAVLVPPHAASHEPSAVAPTPAATPLLNSERRDIGRVAMSVMGLSIGVCVSCVSAWLCPSSLRSMIPSLSCLDGS